jgi:hypothetical protein
MGRVNDVESRMVQDRILAFIVDYQRTNGGVSPTYREIAAQIGRATCSVAARIKRLRETGQLEHSFKNARALRVLRRPPLGPQERLLRQAARYQRQGFVVVYYGNPATGEYTGFDVLAPGDSIFASVRA